MTFFLLTKVHIVHIATINEEKLRFLFLPCKNSINYICKLHRNTCWRSYIRKLNCDLVSLFLKAK